MQSCIPFPWLFLFGVLVCPVNSSASLPRLLAKHAVLTTITCLLSCPNYTKISLSACESVNRNSRGQETSIDKQFGWTKQIKRHHLRELGRKNHQQHSVHPTQSLKVLVLSRDGGRQAQGRNWRRGIERAVNRGEIPNPSRTQHRPSPTASRKKIEKLWSWDHQTYGES